MKHMREMKPTLVVDLCIIFVNLKDTVHCLNKVELIAVYHNLYKIKERNMEMIINQTVSVVTKDTFPLNPKTGLNNIHHYKLRWKTHLLSGRCIDQLEGQGPDER